MVAPCAVLIAAPELLPGLRQRTEHPDDVELLTFTDAEALRALETITKRRPARGDTRTALRGDAARRGADQPHQGRPVARRSPRFASSCTTTPAFRRQRGRRTRPSSVAAATAAAGPLPAARPARHAARAARSHGRAGRRHDRREPRQRSWIFQRSARRSSRATILKPNQRVRMALPDDAGTVRVSANGRVGVVRDPAAERPALSRGRRVRRMPTTEPSTRSAAPRTRVALGTVARRESASGHGARHQPDLVFNRGSAGRNPSARLP